MFAGIARWDDFRFTTIYRNRFEQSALSMDATCLLTADGYLVDLRGNQTCIQIKLL